MSLLATRAANLAKQAKACTTSKASGMTLAEYVVAMAVGTLVVLVLVPFSLYTATSLAGLANYADMNTSSMQAVDRLTHDIRRAARLSEFSTNKVVLDYGSNAPSVRYEYDGVEGELVRKEKDHRVVLLTGCKALTFSIYQRTPIPGTYDQYPAATNTEAKVIAMNWSTARKLLGERSNHDHVHSAKIVIRCR